MNVFDALLSNKTSLVGYNSANEININKIIQNIPNKTVFGLHESVFADQIIDYYNSISYNRDYKISSLINDTDTNYVIININNIVFNDIDTSLAVTEMNLSRRLKHFVLQLQDILYRNSEDNLNLKLIMFSSSYNNISNIQSNLLSRIKGGESLLYLSDFCILLIDDVIKVIKSRDYSVLLDTNKIYSLKRELREFSINKIINDK